MIRPGKAVAALASVAVLCMVPQAGVTAMAQDSVGLYGGVSWVFESNSAQYEENIKADALAISNVDVLNVRSEPNEDAEKIGMLYKDCGGRVLERREGWTKIESGNVTGWACDEYLSFGASVHELTDDSVTMAVATDTLNVRKGSGTDAKVLGRIEQGTVTQVLNQDEDGWLHIEFGDDDGYVLADYMSLFPQLKAGETAEEANARAKSQTVVQYGAHAADMDTTLLLAALIHCEAGGEPYEGQVAVGAVVMNRVRSSAFPDNIYDVIYQPGQFTPVGSGKVDRIYNGNKMYDSCIEAAKEALAGVSNVGDRCFFHRYDGCEGLIIGNHVFK